MNFHGVSARHAGLMIITSVFLAMIALSEEQGMGTDPHLCGGYLRDSRGFIDFKFDENTAPPGIPMQNKFCMWTISPTVPNEYLSYNLTIRNVNLNCPDNDKITISYFHENETSVRPGPESDSICKNPHEVWERKNVKGTVMVVILSVKNIVNGNGFYMEWKEVADSRINGSRIRNTYYSFGRPSIDPIPYFAANLGTNEISTFGFIKANYSTGYKMQMEFTKISHCTGQGQYMECFNNSITIFQVEQDGRLEYKTESSFQNNVSSILPISHINGFFIIAQTENRLHAGAKFTMIYDTVRA